MESAHSWEVESDWCVFLERSSDLRLVPVSQQEVCSVWLWERQGFGLFLPDQSRTRTESLNPPRRRSLELEDKRFWRFVREGYSKT